jgi:hypothetical protein
LNNVISMDLARSVHELWVIGKSSEASFASQKSGDKERVSFGTNMLTDEECSDGGLVEKKPQALKTAVERFHARMF